MGTRVYVGRLPYRAGERDLERFFRGYGKIVEVILKNGYGFVEFADYRDADDAVHDLSGRDLMGERSVKIVFLSWEWDSEWNCEISPYFGAVCKIIREIK